MQVKISFPYSAEKAVGEKVAYFGVDFTITENGPKSCAGIADMSDKDAQAMIDAGRVSAVDEAAKRGRKPQAE